MASTEEMCERQLEKEAFAKWLMEIEERLAAVEERVLSVKADHGGEGEEA